MAVALYARVSTVRQAEQDLSIPDQLQQMRDWCRRQGFLVGQEYVEPGASATDDRRPVFQQMIADATLAPPLLRPSSSTVCPGSSGTRWNSVSTNAS